RGPVMAAPGAATDTSPGQRLTSLPVTLAAPPWLWVWAALFLIGLPERFSYFSSIREQVTFAHESSARIAEIIEAPEFGRLTPLLYPAVAIDVLPVLAILAGLILTLAPVARGRVLTHRYGLEPLPLDHRFLGPTLQDIAAFVRDEFGEARLVANLTRPRTSPFVYAVTFGPPTLAIFYDTIALWTLDRPRAELQLRHELAHLRRGDARLIGIGSPFETVVRWALPATVVLFVAPVLVVHLDNWRTSAAAFAALDLPMVVVNPYGLAPADPAHLAAIGGAYVLAIAAAFITPVATIWSAEFTADRIAVDESRAAEVFGALLTGGAASRWSRMAALLSHPPFALRRWMAQRSDATFSVLLSLLFPLTLLPLFGLLVLRSILLYYANEFTQEDILQSTVANFLIFIESRVPVFWAYGAVLLVWPFACGWWERVAGGASVRQRVYGWQVLTACGALFVALALALMLP
ncbi:MAG: hypothetical protein KC442_11185, partial [Thermomicrobiales bacterium]|nr:hypothetical protein [Thermomicrobiales bacterium]